ATDRSPAAATLVVRTEDAEFLGGSQGERAWCGRETGRYDGRSTLGSDLSHPTASVRRRHRTDPDAAVAPGARVRAAERVCRVGLARTNCHRADARRGG